jgi:signal transduction histidine kinase
MVQDDGVGFDPHAPVTTSADGKRGGMVLRSMRARAEAAGLGLRIEGGPDAGTRVTVTAPHT